MHTPREKKKATRGGARFRRGEIFFVLELEIDKFLRAVLGEQENGKQEGIVACPSSWGGEAAECALLAFQVCEPPPSNFHCKDREEKNEEIIIISKNIQPLEIPIGEDLSDYV